MFRLFDFCKIAAGTHDTNDKEQHQQGKPDFNITYNLVAPHIPTICFLAGKQFQSRQVAHQRNDFLSDFIRFLTMLTQRADNKLMDTV